jgi:hypothetical protein
MKAKMTIYRILDEAAAALDRAGQLLSAHPAGAGRVTAWRNAERTLSAQPHRPRVQIPPTPPGSTRSKA